MIYATDTVEEIHTIRLNPQQAGLRLDKGLTLAAPQLSRATIQRLIKSGQVFRDGEPVGSLSEKGLGGVDYVIHIPPPEPTHLIPEEIPLEILFEDADLIVINKAAGMVVHPGAGVNSGTLVNALLFHCGEDLSGIGGQIRPGIVHRLDKDTSGILVIAKNDLAHQRLATQFEHRTASRHYLAITKGVPKREKGVVDEPIGRHPTLRTKMAVNRKGRRAVTHYQLITPLSPFALISCRLETGRTHQIRVHMAHLGHPLLGDPVYGRRFQPPTKWPEEIRLTVENFNRQALHAATLGFQHPRSQHPLHFHSDPPADFQRLHQQIERLSS
ncbi:MAG: RluA family pseudouridine synthase [Magnetococcales bacterium]|nr:RluA family pseudouridine synthase [Magnetococcales bacterium]